MIEIREDDFYKFCADLDVVLYEDDIQTTINPLFSWDMIVNIAQEDIY